MKSWTRLWLTFGLLRSTSAYWCQGTPKSDAHAQHNAEKIKTTRTPRTHALHTVSQTSYSRTPHMKSLKTAVPVGGDASSGQPQMLSLCDGMDIDQLSVQIAALQKLQAQKLQHSELPTLQCVVAQLYAIDSHGDCVRIGETVVWAPYESEVPAQVGSCVCDMHAEGATGMQAVVDSAGIGLDVNVQGTLPVGTPAFASKVGNQRVHSQMCTVSGALSCCDVLCCCYVANNITSP